MDTKVLVVGGSSGVGLQVVKTLLGRGDRHEVFALVRNQEKASHAIGEDAQRVKFVSGDITKAETLPAVCQGMDAVVCTVGARGGWALPGYNLDSPRQVDYLGVQKLAQAAAKEEVPKFVLVSSAFVTRPTAFVHLLLNTIKGRVMHWKLLGENSVREAYSGSEKLSYFVVRPGGLNDAPGGQFGLTIDQGDKISGSISRADVARVAVACVDGIIPSNVTFEVINNKTQSAPSDLSNIISVKPDSELSS